MVFILSLDHRTLLEDRVTGGQAFDRGQAFMEYRVELPWLAGVCSRMLLVFFLLEDSVLGGHDFTGRCSELYISLCKYDKVVRVCVV